MQERASLGAWQVVPVKPRVDASRLMGSEPCGGVDGEGLQGVASAASLESVAHVFEFLQVAVDRAFADAEAAREFGCRAWLRREVLEQLEQPCRPGRCAGGHGCLYPTPSRADKGGPELARYRVRGAVERRRQAGATRMSRATSAHAGILGRLPLAIGSEGRGSVSLPPVARTG